LAASKQCLAAILSFDQGTRCTLFLTNRVSESLFPFLIIAAQKCQVCLRICVNKQHSFPRFKHRKGTADVKGGCSFANAAFVVDERDDLCHARMVRGEHERDNYYTPQKQKTDRREFQPISVSARIFANRQTTAWSATSRA